MILLYLFLIAFSNAEDSPSKPVEEEHEASVNVEQMLGELDGKCLESTHLMMSNIMYKMKEMKDCFLTPEGSIADMESMSACTAGLEKTVKNFWQETLYKLYHPDIISDSDQGES